jgi:hypothetical protein
VRLLALFMAASLGGCVTVGSPGAGASHDGQLTKEEIQRCLDVPHKVGDRMISPVPLAGNVFKPGYNFTVKEPDGSYGFGHQQAAAGRVIISYPAQGLTAAYDVMRRNGVVYFGKDATSCP